MTLFPLHASPLETIRVWGHDIGAGATNNVWSSSAVWVPPTTARQMLVKSTSMQDSDSAGTGARTVTVYGLDSNYEDQSEVISMKGTNNVTTVNQYTRIQRALITTAGSTTNPTGNLTVTAQTDATVQAYFSANVSAESAGSVYTVPASVNALLSEVHLGAEGQIVYGRISVRMSARDVTNRNIKRVLYYDSMNMTGDGNKTIRFDPPILIPEKHDIELTIQAQDDTSPVHSWFTLLTPGYSSPGFNLV